MEAKSSSQSCRGLRPAANKKFGDDPIFILGNKGIYLLTFLCVLCPFEKKYIKFTICIEEFYQVHCIMPFPFTILSVCPKVAINVELYLAMAMNYYFQAMIGIKALQYLGLTL